MIFSGRTEKKTGPSGERFQLFYVATAFFPAGGTLFWTLATFSVKEKESNGTRLAKRPGCLADELANKGDRRHIVRVTIDDLGLVRSAGGQRSHMLGSLAKANGLVDLPPETRLAKGDPVNVQLIDS